MMLIMNLWEVSNKTAFPVELAGRGRSTLFMFWDPLVSLVCRLGLNQALQLRKFYGLMCNDVFSE